MSCLTHPMTADGFICEGDLKGFGLEITPSGRKSFVAQYLSRDDGRTRRLTIGTYGALTVKEAHSQARRAFWGDAAIGNDPAGKRRQTRMGDNFGEVFKRFLKDHVDKRALAKVPAEV